MEKIILLYSDLEGTILRESDSKYDDTDMYNFLKQLSRLQVARIDGRKSKNAYSFAN